jgi:hypothetical protein
VDRKFVPVEISVVTAKDRFNYPLDSHLKLSDLSNEDRKNAHFVGSAIHGLPLRHPHARLLCKFSSSQVTTLLYEIQASLEQRLGGVVFGCKNSLLARVLKEAEIPYVDLTKPQYQVPTLAALDLLTEDDCWFCYMHTNLPESKDRINFRCSLRKCVRIFNWIQNRIPHLVRLQDKEDNPPPAGEGDRPIHEYRWCLAQGPLGTKELVDFSDGTFSTLEECQADYEQRLGVGADHDIPDCYTRRVMVFVSDKFI